MQNDVVTECETKKKRYSSCRYNERQLIDATEQLSSDVCVHGRNVRVIARGTAGGREPAGLFFAIDLVVCICCRSGYI